MVTIQPVGADAEMMSLPQNPIENPRSAPSLGSLRFVTEMCMTLSDPSLSHEA